MVSNQQGVMRGLSLFIGDIRNCQNKEQEGKVVVKEMAKIRQKFQNRGLSGYDKKKYVWKIIYTYLLGYESDFGYEEALNLINAMKFTEKCTGYIATGIMLNERNDPKIFEPVYNSIKMDLTSGNEICECLALATLANIGSLELSKQLGEVVMKKAFGEISSTLQVRKRAIICLLSFFRRHHALYD
jgi:AP-2 complex subunit alpha